MGKCIRCGKESFLFKHFKLQDGEICKNCFRELGFGKNYDYSTEVYSYDEIKVGKDEMFRIQREKDRKFRENPLSVLLNDEQKDALVKEITKGTGMNDGQKELNANKEESEIFDILGAMYQVYGGKRDDLKFVRYSDNYLSARVGNIDLARFRFGERTQWIFFPNVESKKERHKISTPEDVLQFEKLAQDSIEFIKRYS